MQGAGLFQGFEDGHEVARCRAHLVHGTDDFIQRGAWAELEHRLGLLLRINPRARHNGRLAIGERARLADDRVFGNGHGQAAVGPLAH